MLTFDPPVITQMTAQTETEQKDFIARNVDALACFAYAHYRSEGQGLITLFPEEFRGEKGRVGKGDIYYLRAEALLSFIEWNDANPEARAEFAEELRKALRTYDPMRAILVSFLFLAKENNDDLMSLYLVESITPPPLAYAAYTN